MGYHVDEHMVRVDQFKPTGKWYQSLSIDMSKGYNHYSVKEAVKEALITQGHNIEQWTYVCLEPYHEHSCPVMLKATDLS